MVAVIGIDVILRLTAIELFTWVGYDTYSELMTKIVNGVFLVLFFNTGVILVLVQANLSDVSDGLSNVFDGPFYDYSPKWYATVGATIVSKMLLASLMPPIYESITKA